MRIQMRVELGILQMEAEGRPDAVRPHGCDSLLSHHRKRLAAHEQRNGTGLGYGLSGEDCRALRVEASLFYRRYVALFVLEEYVAVAADTSHSLGIFDLCRDHALEHEDRVSLDEFRPYVLMMDARARAYNALEESAPASALAHVNRGIVAIKTHLENVDMPTTIDASEELRILRAMACEFSQRVPPNSVLVTRKALRDAVQQERFEDAARLRDALKHLKNPKT